MLILGILGCGLIVGAIAQLLLNRQGPGIDWTMAAGSFVGGMLFSLIAGDGLKLRLSGLLGSVIGAVIVTAVWQGTNAKKQKEARAQGQRAQRSPELETSAQRQADGADDGLGLAANLAP